MTKALILAAGQGTRLRPITNDKPKCLVPLMGKSLLERQVDILTLNSIRDIHIATGYCSEQIVTLGFNTSYNERFESTNMVESLFSAIEFIRNCKEDLIISYGDIVYQEENLQQLLSCDDDIVLMVDKNWKSLWSLRLDNPLEDAETFIMNDNGYVTELGKKPSCYEEIQGQYTGLIKVKADKIPEFIEFYQALDRAKIYDGNDFYNMYMTTFLQLLIDSGWNVKAELVEGGWLEIDSLSDLSCYEEMHKKNTLVKFYKG
ncbi:nucleotidyl transferase [Vibrio sp. N418]|uniref:phosphocholine cytidylyltransferase family protein n=1 Tax=Vibrio sp. (strain N418) TaxID=701176 RepID=UPI00021C0A2A|nr:phosphocholine cytidylyltransferase family protein [Vibrio sp. N418]EGU33640.1 nucleotidyl transferase [Vibrio sp. N418]